MEGRRMSILKKMSAAYWFCKENDDIESISELLKTLPYKPGKDEIAFDCHTLYLEELDGTPDYVTAIELIVSWLKEYKGSDLEKLDAVIKEANTPKTYEDGRRDMKSEVIARLGIMAIDARHSNPELYEIVEEVSKL